MADAQAMTIPEKAVQAALDKWRDHELDGTLDNPRMRAALTAAAPYMRYKREFNISSCTVDLSGADYKCFLDGVTGFEVSLDEETRSFGEYNEGDRVFFDAETGDLDAHDLFILSRPAFEKKVQERISALPHMSASAREQALDLSVLERLAKIADEYDEPDENGPFPDIQDAMISIRDLRQIRQLLATIRALKSQPAPQTGGAE